MEKITIFIIQGFESENPRGNLADVTTIELIDNSTENAMARAKKIIKKKFYRVSSVIEREAGK